MIWAWNSSGCSAEMNGKACLNYPKKMLSFTKWFIRNVVITIDWELWRVAGLNAFANAVKWVVSKKFTTALRFCEVKVEVKNRPKIKGQLTSEDVNLRRSHVGYESVAEMFPSCPQTTTYIFKVMQIILEFLNHSFKEPVALTIFFESKPGFEEVLCQESEVQKLALFNNLFS